MPKKSSSSNTKKSTKEKSILPNLPLQLLPRADYIRPYLTSLGTTKSWLTTSKRCNNKQPHHPQLSVSPDSGCAWGNYYAFTSKLSEHYNPRPPPAFPDNLYELSRSYSCELNPDGTRFSSKYLTLILTLTEASNPAIVFYSNEVLGEGLYRQQWIIHESTITDPYDAEGRFMKFTNVIMSSDGSKFYALSSQGCLVEMEEDNEARFIIKGMCRTRAVPSVSTKCFKEYLFESRGETYLVFLIYRKGNSSGVADEIEVYRVDVGDRLELNKVDRLEGRVLFLDKECCLWYDSRKLGCKDSCIYFTGEFDGNNGWWMCDMESRSISAAWKKRTRIRFDVSTIEIEPVLCRH